MHRLTITLPDTIYNHLSLQASQCEGSISSVINRLIRIGMQYVDERNQAKSVEQHCHHLIIQMNALLKNLSVEILELNQDDFEQLRQAAWNKYNELANCG